MAIGNIVVVEPGDTLASIAKDWLGDERFAGALAGVNGIPNPKATLPPGVVLQLPKVEQTSRELQVGDIVEKTSGDYRFKGEIVAAFPKKGGQRRFVVEDDRGLLFIFSPKQLTRVAS